MSSINAYFENLSALINRTLTTQQPVMEEAARAIAECFRNDGMFPVTVCVYVIDNMLVCEIYDGAVEHAAAPVQTQPPRQSTGGLDW
jgi:uncharacterized phosphosugar-binding protein